jgi:hypothetical protein|tara:strand:- start:596 stop:772 length:177 start_codon:yes stop_codon:yes gene_type:complete
MRWMPQSYYDTLKRVSQAIRGVEDKEVRARDDKGKYQADDPETPENEAYETIEVPNEE